MTEEILYCPCCNGGQLKKVKDWESCDYICMGCDRGWEIDKVGNWHVRFAADWKHIYTTDEFERTQKYWRERRKNDG